MKKRESLAEVLERLTRDFVEAVVREAEASVAGARGRKEARARRSIPEAARRARMPRARTVAPTKAAPAAKSTRAKASPKKPLGKKKIEELGAAVVNPELLLAAIDHAEHAHEPPAPPPPPASEPSAKAEPPAILAEPEAPAPASGTTPKAPPLKENETAITTPSGAIVIRRSRAA